MSTNKFWTEKRLYTGIQILKDHSSLDAAIEEFNEVFDTKKTKASLRKALSRNGKKAPSFYLGKNIDDDDDLGQNDLNNEDDGEEAEFRDKGYEWEIDKEDEIYKLKRSYKGLTKDFDVPFDIIEDIFILYSNEYPGQGCTKGEIVEKLATSPNTEQMTFLHDKEVLRSLFHFTNFDKSNFPAPPHLEGTTNKEIIDYIYQRGDVLRKQIISRDKKKLKHLENSLERAYSRLIDFRRIFQLDKDSRQRKQRRATIDYTSSADAFIQDGGEILIGVIADMHAGKEVIEKQLQNTGNEYNQNIFYNRVRTACKVNNKIAKWWKDEVKEVQLISLGDNWEALLENMRKGQSFNMYGSPKENWDDVVWAHCQFVEAYKQAIPDDVPIKYTLIGGNHDRLMKEKSPDSEVFLNYMLCDRLRSEFQQDDQIEVIEGAPVTSILLQNGLNILATHGHLKKIKKSNLDQMINTHGYPNANRYLALQGHLHRFEVFESKSDKGTAITVPSFVGGDSYVTDNHFKNCRSKMIAIKSNIQHEDDQILGPFDLESRQEF